MASIPGIPPPPQIFVMNPGFTGQDSVLSQSPCQLVGCLGVPKGFNDQDPGFYDSPRSEPFVLVRIQSSSVRIQCSS
jgi:hypothetical protein